VRVTTGFNRMLRLPGASVIDVSFSAEGVIVTVRLRRRRRVGSGCGQLGGQIHGRRVKRWRHLDLGSSRCVIECELRRLWCSDCGARFEAVPWARSGSRYTRDFEDVVCWLAQQMAKKPIAGLLRIARDTVGRIVERVVEDHLDERRLDGLVAIGVDEISYRRHHRYLTSVVDHQAGAIVWCAPGRNAATMQAFFDELGERRHTIKAVSMDMSAAMRRPSATRFRRPRSPSIPSTWCVWHSGRSTRSAAMSGTRMSAHTPPPASGSRARAVALEGSGQAERRTARAAGRGPAGQQGALPRLPSDHPDPKYGSAIDSVIAPTLAPKS
jgi:transposase